MAPTKIKIKNPAPVDHRGIQRFLVQSLSDKYAQCVFQKEAIIDDLQDQLQEQRFQLSFTNRVLSNVTTELNSVKAELKALKAKEAKRTGLPQLLNSSVVAAPFVATAVVGTATVAGVAVPLGCAAWLGNELTKVR